MGSKSKNNNKIKSRNNRIIFSVILAISLISFGLFLSWQTIAAAGSFSLKDILSDGKRVLDGIWIDKKITYIVDSQIDSGKKSQKEEGLYSENFVLPTPIPKDGDYVLSTDGNGGLKWSLTNTESSLSGNEIDGKIAHQTNELVLTEEGQFDIERGGDVFDGVFAKKGSLLIGNGSGYTSANLISSDSSIVFGNRFGSIDLTSSLGKKVDISGETNLRIDKELKLTGDFLSISSSIARDSELHNAITLNGPADYITLDGQNISRNLINLTSHITGILPIANGGTGTASGSPTFTGLTLEGNQVLNGAFSIRESGTSSAYYTTFVGADQAGNITYTLPTGAPAGNNYVLTAQTDGTMTWSSVSGTGGVSGIGSANQVAYWTDSNTITGENYLSISRGGTGTATLNDLISLGIHTSGSYISTITGNTQIVVGGVGAENAIATLALGTDSIGDAQLVFDTGQNLTVISNPTFSGLNLSNLTSGSVVFVGVDGLISQNNTDFFWDNINSRLGIGTVNPLVSLDIVGGIAGRNVSGSNNGAFIYDIDAGNARLTLYDSTGNGAFRFDSTGGSYALGDSFGIGDSSPDGKLEVRQTATADVLNLYDGSSNVFTVVDGGNVGIGNISPQQKLDVNGIILATGGSSTNWNTAYGWGNHASFGYLTSEVDPIFVASDAYGISATDISNWNSSYSGGISGSGTSGYLLKFTGTNSVSNSILQDSGIGEVRVVGNIMPEMTGATGNISIRNIGDEDNRFGHIWAEDVHIGANSLYVNGKKVISDVSSVMNFTTDIDQSMIVKSTGIGSLGLQSDQGTLFLNSNALISANGKGGISLLVSSDNPSMNLNLTNSSLNGNITFNGTGSNSQILASAVQKISLTAPSVELNGIVTAGTWRGTAIEDGYIASAATWNAMQSSLGFTPLDIAGSNTMTANLKLGNHTLIGGTSTIDILKLQGTSGNGTLTSPAIQMNVGDNGATNALTVLNNGNVGIGTTSPGAKLEVAGGTDGRLKIYGDSYQSNMRVATGGVYWTAGTIENETAFWQFSASGGINNLKTGSRDFQIYATDSNNPIAYFTTTGNVGIGTTTPSAKLSIKGAGTTTGINFQTTNSAGSPLVTMLDSGNVGIGTTTPAYALDVAGNVYFRQVVGQNQLVVGQASAQSGYRAFIKAGNLANIGLGIRGASGQTANLFQWENDSGTGLGGIDASGNVGIGTTSPTSPLHIEADNDPKAILVNNGGLRMNGGNSFFIFSNLASNSFDGISNVINNFNNYAGLLLRKTSTGTGDYFLVEDSATNSIFKIDTNGRVGIGTTSPGEKLEVDNGNIIANIGKVISAATNYRFTMDATNGGGPRLSLGNNSVPSSFFEIGAWSDRNNFDTKARDLQFYSTAAPIGFILKQDTGNVGIGTTSPGDKLTISGGSFAIRETDDGNDALRFDSGTQSGALRLYSNGTKTIEIHGYDTNPSYFNGGNVGIGTTSPQAKLDVSNLVTDNTDNSIGVRTSITANATSDNSGSVYGLIFSSNSGKDSYNRTGSLYGLQGFSYHNGTGTLGTAVGGKLGVRVNADSPGIINSVNGIEVSSGISSGKSGRILNNYDIRLNSPLLGTGGEIINDYGLYIGNRVGTGLNYSIYTGTAQSYFGGNVGIGTESPLSLLHLGGTPGSLASGLTFGDGDSGFYENSDDVLRLQLGGNLAIQMYYDFIKGSSSGAFSMRSLSGSALYPTYSFIGDENTGLFSNTADVLQFSTNGSEKMRIDTAGNIGIGTTSPTVALEIQGGTDPKIKIKGTRPYLSLETTQTGNTDWTFVGGYYSADSLSVRAGTANIMTFLNNGNIGIGTTSSSAKLSIKGTGTTTGINFQTTDSAGSPLVTMFDNGKVGVGTTSPLTTLDVVGNFQFRDAETPTKGVRYRFGSATDLEASGAPLYFSVWDDSNFLGFQRQKMVMFSGSNETHGLKKWVWKDYVGASINHIIDGSGGVVFNESGNDFDTRIEGDTDQNLLFIDASTDRIGIGTSTPDRAKLVVEGSVTYDNGVYGFLDSSGTVNTSSGAVNTSIYASNRIVASEFDAVSDRRVKIDINHISNALDLVENLDVVAYNKLTKDSPSAMGEMGLIAQDLVDVFPLAVRVSQGQVPGINGEWKNVNDFHSVNYQTVTMLGIQAIQELASTVKNREEMILKNVDKVTTLDLRTQNIVLAEKGKTIFKGMVVADVLKANRIEGLEFITKDIADTDMNLAKTAEELETLALQVESLNQDFSKMTSSFSVKNLEVMSLAKLKELEVNDAVTFKGKAEFQGPVVFRKIAEFIDKTVFRNDVEFAGRVENKGTVTFNSDTAGYAVIKSGKNKVDVVFKNEYTTTPIITATLRSAVKLDWYRVTDESTKGFTIEIDPEKEKDIKFAWTAVMVSDAEETKSEESKGDSDDDIDVGSNIEENNSFEDNIPETKPNIIDGDEEFNQVDEDESAMDSQIEVEKIIAPVDIEKEIN